MGSLPDRLPGHQVFSDEGAIRRFEKRWGKPIPRRRGLGAVEMFEGAEAGTIKAMYVMGENPVRAFPDSNRIVKALSSLDFLVVQELFMSETARLAHVVLPACSFAEKDGAFTSMERRVQRIRKSIEPIGRSRPDWKILCTLSERLGYPMNHSSIEVLVEEIASLVPGYGGISMAKLERGGVFWPCPDAGSEGERRISPDGWKTGDGEAGMSAAPPRIPEWKDNDSFLLVRGSMLYHFLSGTRTAKSRRLRGMAAPGRLAMNRLDALDHGLREGDSIKLFNDSGTVSMAIGLDESLQRGMLFCPYAENSVSALFASAHGAPGLNTCRVGIERRPAHK
jgi:predicted molibdopterin-dependent oxidoreductase YjgC